MSSGCVLMRIILSRYFLLLISVFTEARCRVFAQPFIDNKFNFELSGDFMNFVKDMDRVVYKNEAFIKVTVAPKRLTTKQPQVTPAPRRKDMEADERDHAQKVALQDVLMMKLVSYYEDKYKLSHDNIHTTDSPSNNNMLIVDSTTEKIFHRQDRITEATPLTNSEDDSPVPEVITI